MVEKDANAVSPGARSGVRLPTTVGPEAPLLVHVGNPKYAARAAIEHDIGALVWRGRTGADLIADQLRDPVTGEDALLDFATYERDQYAKDASVALPLGGSHLSLAFTPGIFADHREPQGLTSFLSSVPQEHAKLRTLGLEEAPMVPVVALTTQWLTDGSLLDRATSEIRAFDGLVGVVLASFMNPLHGAGAIRGCVDLVRSTGNVVALRGDESMIGLLAHGAALASVGTSSTVRHLFYGRPPKERGQRGHEVFHLPTLSWIKHFRLELFAVPTEALLCTCSVCEGESILRLAEKERVVEATAHSMACLQRCAADVMGAADPAERWSAVCAEAAETAQRLSRIATEFRLGASARAWCSALQPTS